jgi:hypothetical protein
MQIQTEFCVLFCNSCHFQTEGPYVFYSSVIKYRYKVTN